MVGGVYLVAYLVLARTVRLSEVAEVTALVTRRLGRRR